MSSVLAYRYADAIAPYREYRTTARLLVHAGGMQLPLAYTGRTDALGTDLPTSRLFQGMQPTCSFVIEWQGVRKHEKPEPPLITTLGTFILALAGAQVDGVYRDTDLTDLIGASGFFVLHSATRPEKAIVPAFWTPYDGRYGTSASAVAQYSYTPEELGFGQLLPGVTTTSTPGNPTLQGTTNGNQVK